MTMWTLVLLCSVIISHGVQDVTAGARYVRPTVEAITVAETDISAVTMLEMTTDPPTDITTATPAPCGGYLWDSAGAFASPGYPGPYPNDIACVWSINTGPGRQIIELQFTHVDVEGGFNCRYDGIYVYDGSETYNRLLGTLCGRQTSTFFSTSQYLTVLFTSDDSSYYGGFQAQYHTVAGGSCKYNCGYQVGNCSCASGCEYGDDCCSDYEMYGCAAGTTTTTTTTVLDTTTSRPTPPEPTSEEYVSCRDNCGNHFAMCSCDSSCQNYGGCCYDYSEYCQATTSLPSTPDFTEVTLPSTTAQPSCRDNCGSSMGNCTCFSYCQYIGNCCYDYNTYCQAAVTEHQTALTTGLSCGASLHGSGSLSSPHYPNYYHDNEQCVWYLTAPVGQKVFLSITDFQMQNCCGCDYINLYDGPYVGSHFLAQVCSTSTVKTFLSSSNHMTVLFRTDASLVGRGFNAEFTSTLSPGTGSVDCSSDNMHIVIARSYLDSLGYDGHNLYLNDQFCRPRVSSQQVVFSFPLNTCGTQRTFENDRAVYTNAVRAYASTSGEITRQSHFKLNVTCRMEQDTMVQIMYKVREEDNSTVTGSGRFNATMAFYTDSSFRVQVTQVPYLVVLNQPMYVQVNLRRDDNTLVLFLDTCVASPSPHDFSSRHYTLISNGCPKDGTRVYSSGRESKASFTFRAFQFLRAHESVYLQCKILICQASDHNSRCRKVQDCRTRKARDLGSDSAHESHVILLGPIRLKDPEMQDEAKARVEA